ncbi:MAG TPA: diguanylate cyclase [Solirubrobacteraceae bacterium]|nr:diguanylate cyclase [Solirubrobacteraceae bacterium]
MTGVLALLVLHRLLGVGGSGVLDDGAYQALLLCAALLVIARGVRIREQRTAWLFLGAALVLESLGELYYQLFLHGRTQPDGSLTPGDVLLLSFYPCCFIAIVLLIASQTREQRLGMWLDGIIGGLGATTVSAAVVLPTILQHTTGNAGAVAIELAYPVGDLLLLVFAGLALGVTGWRPGRVWMLIGASFLISGVGDAIYLFQTANASYREGAPLECLWPFASLLLALAAWTPWPAQERRPLKVWRLMAVPTISLLAAVGVLAYGNVHHRLALSVLILAMVTAVAVGAHLMVTVYENVQMLTSSQRQALTDPLTGLGNRRQLMEDLSAVCGPTHVGESWALVLYDLNGFKNYNDSFGHPAGDALLVRLGEKLSRAVAAYGTAYRMGGDEFCVLMRSSTPGAAAALTESLTALTEQGPGFSITAAHGAAVIPSGTSDPSAIVKLADQGLYQRKDQMREASTVLQLRDVLLQAFQERYPDLQEHLRGVGTLAIEVARRLGVKGEELEVLARAAELHDVGKIAIPDAILNKPGPLNEEEWLFMRRHTLLGERILTAAAPLRPVAELVRSSHERFDGAGYPDGLAGDQIPLGARIIFVCDAYAAMRSKRSHSPALTPEAALGELRSGAGAQFDPVVVRAFLEALKGSADAEDLEDALASGEHHGRPLA